MGRLRVHQVQEGEIVEVEAKEGVALTVADHVARDKVCHATD